MDIFVGSLSFKLRESELREAFEKYGEVTSAKIIIDKITRQSKGFGFVEMPDEGQATLAINELNGKDMYGRPLVVNRSQKRDAPAPGGGGGGRYDGQNRPAQSGGGYRGPSENRGYQGGNSGYGGASPAPGRPQENRYAPRPDTGQDDDDDDAPKKSPAGGGDSFNSGGFPAARSADRSKPAKPDHSKSNSNNNNRNDFKRAQAYAKKGGANSNRYISEDDDDGAW